MASFKNYSLKSDVAHFSLSLIGNVITFSDVVHKALAFCFLFIARCKRVHVFTVNKAISAIHMFRLIISTFRSGVSDLGHCCVASFAHMPTVRSVVVFLFPSHFQKWDNPFQYFHSYHSEVTCQTALQEQCESCTSTANKDGNPQTPFSIMHFSLPCSHCDFDFLQFPRDVFIHQDLPSGNNSFEEVQYYLCMGHMRERICELSKPSNLETVQEGRIIGLSPIASYNQ